MTNVEKVVIYWDKNILGYTILAQHYRDLREVKIIILTYNIPHHPNKSYEGPFPLFLYIN